MFLDCKQQGITRRIYIHIKAAEFEVEKIFPEALKLAWVREKLGLDQGRRTKKVKIKD